MLTGLKVLRARERTTGLVSERFQEVTQSRLSRLRGMPLSGCPKGKNPRPDQRNEAVGTYSSMVYLMWKKVRGCHQRSLNETVMFRYKTVFGSELKARTAANQTAEVMLKCLLLNTFRETGIPDSYKVA
jgi:hypothetical protein